MGNLIEFGIDLGTTNSCIARWEDGKVRIFPNNDQMNVTPSVIHFHKTGRVIVGKRACAARLKDSHRVVSEFKRWMGQKDSFLDLASGRKWSAEELSAEVLKSLREDVRRQTGADVVTAVITVPAAFGALQCEATARAAKLAGIEEAPLLQEPISAAIGYGARPDSSNQRWLVFDLGGGTFDVAVISARDGRLDILELSGSNMLGGKDIDRAIVEQVLLPALESAYNLSEYGPGSARDTVLQLLKNKAEEAKIDLSTTNHVVISLDELGEDDCGTPIELDIPLTQSELENLTEPLFSKCCDLTCEALSNARIQGTDLNRILLVGGPTQSPFLRKMLSTRIGAPVDCSIDAMTVVARGAAIYASSLERSNRPVSTTTGNLVHLKLAFEPVSAELESSVAGRILNANQHIEIKIESEKGNWASDWIKPNDGIFETLVPLKEGDKTTFWVYARDRQGRLLEVDTPDFTIRHGLVPSAPPLPHTLSIEVVQPGRAPKLDPVFTKGTPLPAEKTVLYRAAHTLFPGKPESDLAIKLWEGEFLDDPDVNEWVGPIVVSHDLVKKSVPEGSEIDVRIQVNASRQITVEVDIPCLKQHISKGLYMPQREEQDYANQSMKVARNYHEYQERLKSIEDQLSGQPDTSTQDELEVLRKELVELDKVVQTTWNESGRINPDDAKRIVAGSKKVLGKLSRLERRAGVTNPKRELMQFTELMEFATQVVDHFGTTLEKQQLAMLGRELEHAISKDNQTAIQYVREKLDNLGRQVLYKQNWFWKDVFESLCQSETQFADRAEAQRLIYKGRSAISAGDVMKLKEVVWALQKLQPRDIAEETVERVMRSGLRKF